MATQVMNDVGLLRRENRENRENRETTEARETDEGPALKESILPPDPMIREKKPFFQELLANKKKRWMLAVPLALLVVGLGRWIYVGLNTESTDDSFVSAHVHMVGARVGGTVMDVSVNDNQIVKKGDILIKLDPKDFEIQEKIAKANALKAHVNLQRWDGGGLHPNEVIQKNIDTANALAADAALEQAELNLKYSEVRAAEDGKVGNRAVETGQQVQPGQALMALVERTPWVIANYKENQASHIRPGQLAEISVDAIPDHEFTGHVDSVAPGSGATFSLLPPDNATGNFTKIVQRIPVKVVFDADSIKGYEDRLTAGMSVSVTVHH
jgi:membrane fusion protein (multidrug efflux system)